MRYLKPKAKLCRRLGVNLFGTEKYTKIMRRRQSKPGVHGGKFSKKSEYGHQLEEKQKAKFVFGIHERQFQKYFKKAASQHGDTAENLLRLLETRLDNVVYVSQFAVTRVQARQMVAHGHFRVNGHRVDIPSIIVRPGDKITIAPKLKDSTLYAGLEKLKDYAPKWLKVDIISISAEVVALPEKDDLEKTFNSQLIVEFYSR